jgi:hypothetical protein
MTSGSIKSFTYRCGCGYVISVFVDFGTPQESVACRKCRRAGRRDEL